MGYLLYSLLNTALSLYRFAVIAYVAISWLRIPANQWKELLRRLVLLLLLEIVGSLLRTVLFMMF